MAQAVTPIQTADEDERELVHTIARLHARALALVGGLLGGTGVFVMTVWLLVKGGRSVGAHLQLLGQYFYGYSVTWGGSIVGFFYGAATGAAVGWSIGAVYNIVVGLRE